MPCVIYVYGVEIVKKYFKNKDLKDLRSSAQSTYMRILFLGEGFSRLSGIRVLAEMPENLGRDDAEVAGGGTFLEPAAQSRLLGFGRLHGQ